MGKSALHVLAKRSQPDFGLRDKEREKRKKILKMCVQKLRDIDDPETVLCRAVLINNTFKSLKYAYRRVFRAQEPEPVPAPVYIQHQHQQSEDSDNDTEEEEQEDSVSSDESSNSEDESGHASSSDNDQDSDADSDTVPSLDTDHGPGPDPAAFCPDELDTFTDPGCDMTNFSAESIVHSLMMPPLLSPQIEDMTNCSFYDSFASDAGVPSPASSPASSPGTVPSMASEDVRASFKLAVVPDTMTASATDPVPAHPAYSASPSSPSSSSTPGLDYCQETAFPRTCVQSDMGSHSSCNSILIDNLLTEIVQA